MPQMLFRVHMQLSSVKMEQQVRNIDEPPRIRWYFRKLEAREGHAFQRRRAREDFRDCPDTVASAEYST
jgi:hypothetical protein